jgi:hypothetical protein
VAVDGGGTRNERPLFRRIVHHNTINFNYIEVLALEKGFIFLILLSYGIFCFARAFLTAES